MVEAVAEDVGVDFKESGSGFVAVEKAEDSSLNLEESFAHGGLFFWLWKCEGLQRNEL